MNAFLKKLENNIWQGDISRMTLVPRALLFVLRLFLVLWRDARIGSLPLYAASLVYTTLLSLAPLLAICFSVLKGIGVHNQIEPFLKEILSPLGSNAADISDRIVSFVDKIQVGVLGVVGVAILLYSVIALMRKIEDALNDIWHVQRARSLLRRVRDYLSILLIGPLLLFLSVGMTASLHHAATIDRWLGISFFTGAAETLFSAVPFLLFCVVFCLLYMVMPNTRVRFIPALAAGILTAALWKVLGFLFGIFVTGSASYAAIYSAFATLILFMIWLYVGWMVVLIGSAVSYYLQNPSDMAAGRGAVFTLAHKERLVFDIMAVVGASFYQDKSGLSAATICARVLAPRLIVRGVIEELQDAGLLLSDGAIDPRYIPAVPLDTTSLWDVHQRMREKDIKRKDKTLSRVDSACAKAEDARAAVLKNISIKFLATGEEK